MPETKVRTVRVPDELWEAAQERAAAEGTTVAAVLVGALKRYVTRPPRTRQD